MDRPENTPEYWQMKAQQARALAACLKDSRARVHMLTAAESYDKLAGMAENGPLVLSGTKPANGS